MTKKQIIKQDKRQRRKNRVRSKIFGTSQRPRFNVFRSLNNIYVQVIDDNKGSTLVSVNSKEIKNDKVSKTEVAFKLGELAAQKCQKAGISTVVFDKSGFKYHGRVKALAEGARKGGLKF